MKGILAFCFVSLFLAAVRGLEEDDLGWCDANENESCGQARAILELESDEAKQHKCNGSERLTDVRLSSFLSSTQKIKGLSHSALYQTLNLQICKRKWKRWPCGSFWANVKQLCKSLENLLEHCPFFIPDCRQVSNKFRTINGTCNNKNHPLIGSAGRAHRRLLDADYYDCVDEPRDTVTGLPSARAISNAIFEADIIPTSSIVTVLHMSYGQLIDHDTDVTPVVKLENKETGELEDVDCGASECETDHMAKRSCLPMAVPPGDAIFGNRTCLRFIRSEQVPFDDCRVAPRQQANDITSWIDASFVYGSYDDEAAKLRTKVNGTLRVRPHPFNSEFLPMLPPKNDSSCVNTNPDVGIQCSLAGDRRQNEQTVLTALHIVFVRYHNYIAENLQRHHPEYTDEELYQNARRILTAVYQNTLYSEYLPPVLGKKIMDKFKLNVNSKNYFKQYENDITKVNPDTANVFSTAAFRFGHSQVPTKSRFADPSLTHKEDVFFTKILFDPTRLFRSGILNDSISGVNAMIIGQSDQPGDKVDSVFTRQVKDFLFTDFPPSGAGHDLPARNIQRGRDHGLPGYTKWRQFCNGVFDDFKVREYVGKDDIESFNDLEEFIETSKLNKLKDVYNNKVHDVDLFPAAMMETHVRGGIVGPTFACIIALDFHNKKFGDRFYFETKDKKIRFTKKQLKNIRQQTLSSILCKTLEDDPDNPSLALNFQKQVLLLTREQANALSSNANAAETEKLQLYTDSNERLPCSQHAQLDFTLF